MTDRTIVGWDGSEESDVALAWAVGRARTERDGILLVDIEDPAALAPGQVITAELVARRHLAADAKAQRVSDANGSLSISTHVMAGDRREELRRFTRPDTFLVVGTGERHRAGTRIQPVGAQLGEPRADPRDPGVDDRRRARMPDLISDLFRLYSEQIEHLPDVGG